MPYRVRPFISRILLAQAMLGSALVVLSTSAAEAKIKSATSGQIQGYLAEHTTSPQNVASRKITLEAEEKLKFDPWWSMVISGRNWYETEYYSYLQYPQQLRDQDSQDLRFEDTYLQVKTDHFVIRAGYQQIVWGETFGSFYADIVNPKDLRQGIPPDSSSIRLATPALNARYINKRFSLQGIFLPQSYYNILPLTGSDYSPPLAQLTGFQNVTLNRELNSVWSPDHSEWGGRVSDTFGNVDLSAFGMSYYDRTPYYSVGKGTVPYSNLVLDEHHSRINSAGGSLAADFAGFVLRGEGVYTNNHFLPTLQGNSVIDELTDEFAYAASIDFPTLQRLNLTFQYSNSKLLSDFNYLLRAENVTYLTLRALLNVFDSGQLSLLMTYSENDSGIRTQLEYSQPLNSIFEFRAGIENYNGSSDSDFGRLPRASRAYLMLTGKLTDGKSNVTL